MPIFSGSSPHHQQRQDNNLLDYPHHQHQADNPTNYFDPDPANYLDPVPVKFNLDSLDLDMNDVRSGGYRAKCLKPNGIYIQLPSNPLPPTVALLTKQMLTMAVMTPPSPGMLAAMMDKLDDLSTHSCSEQDIRLCLEGLFTTMTLPRELRACHQRDIARHLLPACPAGFPALPQPFPDLLYGYCIWSAFTQAQDTVLENIHPSIPSYAQATADITFPFFAVELQAAASTGGSLWDAANECAGSAAACLQALDQLNTALSATGCQGRRIPNVCYCLAIDNNLGQLYTSWKDEDGSTVHMQRVASYSLSDTEHFARLYACVASILKWGATTRLQDIRMAADYIGRVGGE
ncbi:hypothetical protein B0T25DRAFT_563019 [Lasiosphaeria hispida]|uniref:DUF7924 domain-containing protein n=1 Tax=Lasiosphaeria hispida TaxID=260671 RepID=A0AAJ0MKP8_9PEZI|nr:hypothetical protein B0T25DRAFT_563019 [Lasiosphaeria hispida]